MKFKFNAGAELDLLTKNEVEDALKAAARDWMVEARRGPKLIDWWGQGVVAADGTLSMGGEAAGADSGRWGPDVGLLWSVRRWNVRGLTGAEKLSAWIDVPTPQRSVIDGVTGSNVWGSDALVLRGGSRLLFTGTGLTVGEVITVGGMAWELPAAMMYKLL